MRLPAGILCLVLGLALISLAGCASPTRPSQPRPVRLALAGQSNSMLLRPALGNAVVAFYGEVQPIACWTVTERCWSLLRPQLQPVDAFVWWQGEYDAMLETRDYSARLSDLVARVRAAVGNPRLLVVVPQMGPMFDGPRMGTAGDALQRERKAWVAQDINALYIETQDLPYQADEVHMTPEGYAGVAARVLARVEARR